MPDHTNDTLVQQYLSTSCEFNVDLNTEGETHYRLLNAMNDMRPSIIFGLARMANDQSHFASLLMQASVACSRIADAETIASQAIADTPAEFPDRADAIWFLILLAAAQAEAGDYDWREAKDLCQKIITNMERGK